MGLSFWENLFLVLMALVVIVWMIPSIKAKAMPKKDVKADWIGALLPIGLVLLFVVFLLVIV